MIELRAYQREGLDALWSYWDHSIGSPLEVAPTGSGKSVMIAAFIKEARERYPSTRFLIVTHVKELIRQNFRAMLRAWPTAPAGIYSAGLNQKSTANPITFCGIQSVHAHAGKFGFIDLLLIDEAHLLSRRGDSMYQKFIAALRVANPAMKVIGFTATPYRLDSGRLDKGPNRLFDGIAHEIGIMELVEQGYLAPLVGKATALKLDTSSVHKRGGEFIEAELQKAVDTNSATEAACREITAYGTNRRSWLCFCAGVEHARHVADALRASGVAAAHVSGDMATGERDRILGAFLSGQLKAVANANILTTGFDHPPLDLIAMLRPTLSAGLYVQMLGRGMRTHDGKQNCVVLDFARNIERHGPVDAVRIKDPSAGGGPAPVKTCPECNSILHASARVCPDCGFAFPLFDPDARLSETASTAAVMSREVKPEWLAVQGWRLVRHDGKDGKPDSVRVEYRCGLQVHKEWVCFDHEPGTFPRKKAEQWWRMHEDVWPAPDSVLDVLKHAGELRAPSEILVRRAGKYFEVASRRFARIEERAA